MGYFLNAIICGHENAKNIAVENQYAKIIEIYDDLCLITVIKELYDEIVHNEQPTEFLSDIDFFNDDKFKEYLKAQSANGKIAIVEAVYHGGQGNQSGILWENGNIVFEEIKAKWVIDKILRQFGVVVAEKKYDEFETVGLDRYRDTEAWYDEA